MRAVLVLALAFALTGCGGAREHGTATLWVTRDRGAHVLYSGKVPAGLTALQALDRRTDVKTRYGGRFVQAINGVEGDAGKQRDWFYFVNGIESDRGAADYRLHPGDVEWWDFRSWKGAAQSVPAVVGAFPEPFVHGFDGKRADVVVFVDLVGLHAETAGEQRDEERLAKLIHASRARAKKGAARYLFLIRDVPTSFRATRDSGGITFRADFADVERLLADPTLARYRYQGLRQ